MSPWRALAESRELVVIDEFTSTVDRQVAQVASHTIQKALSVQTEVVDWRPDEAWMRQYARVAREVAPYTDADDVTGDDVRQPARELGAAERPA